jgi:hypothetical protein
VCAIPFHEGLITIELTGLRIKGGNNSMFNDGVSALTDKQKEHRLWENLGMEVGDCPYCGGYDTIIVQNISTGRWGIDCRKCNGGLPTNFATAEEAVAIFNKRAH